MDASRAVQRRRRVLLDETRRHHSQMDDNPPASASPSGPCRAATRYSHWASRKYQPSITDLLRLRTTTLVILALVALSGIAAALAAYGQTWLHHTYLPPAVVHLADVSAHDSLARCVTAALYAFLAATSVVIFQVRRYRLDDYRGTYRLWLWTCAFALAAMIDQLGAVHQAWVQAAQILVELPLAYAELWWLVPAGSILAIISFRMTREIRSQPLALVLWWVGCALLLGAWLVRSRDVRLPGAEVLVAMLGYSCSAVAAWCFLGAAVVYGRSVLREVEQGTAQHPLTAETAASANPEISEQAAPRCPASPDDSATSAQSSSAKPSYGATIRRQQDASNEPSRPENRTLQPSATHPAPSTSANQDSLSRAERKRLAKLQRRQAA
jgi:hypothetical protein